MNCIVMSRCDVTLPWTAIGSLTYCLEVEGHELAAGVPEDLGHVVGGVDPRAFRVQPAQLPLVVSEQSRLWTLKRAGIG